VLTSELDYRLPTCAIAQVPVEPRDAARLLVDRGAGVLADHRHVRDLADLLGPGDLLVVNDTRVIPARLRLRKPTGGAVEVLLLERRPEGHWEALVRPSRRVADGTILTSDAHPELAVAVGPAVGPEGRVAGPDGRRTVTIHHRHLQPRSTSWPSPGAGPEVRSSIDLGSGADVDAELALLQKAGEVPLPPYVHEPLADPERYQTVYAARPGSVAAPTAGLHLTDHLLARCRARGVAVADVELVVGLGTFRPVTTHRVEDHPMHAERYRVPPAAQELVRAHAGRVVAVGTTVVRALESWAATGEAEGSTDLFIHGDRPFAAVDRLLTNFHVPRSSLLALVQAFVGPRWRDLYASALDDGYRFLSFGDAMLLDRHLRRAAG